MQAPQPSTDPFAYRWFSIRGILIAGEKRVMITEGAHAEDLPEGEAGKTAIVERVRKHYGAMYGDPQAVWESLHVYEIPPENGFLTEKLPFSP